MRYLIVSDIHGNWEALEAVLAQARDSYDRILCCGDLVGYGADPNNVIDWAREHVELIVRGNHDRACSGSDDLEWFNPVARSSALWTYHVLRPENLDYLLRLPKGPLQWNGFQVLHGSPLDEDEYLLTNHDVSQVFPYLDAELSFFGHTHLQGGFLLHRNGVKRLAGPVPEYDRLTLELEKDVRYLINPGSVGQPRDGDARAAYVVYLPESRLVDFRRAAYDVTAAQSKIVAAGLPDLLAERLATGC